MRIISRSQDYYDGYQNYDRKDRFNKVWVRKSKLVEVNVNKLKLFEERCIRLRLGRWDAGYIILAGTVIPYVCNNHYDVSRIRYYFDPQEAFENYKEAYDNDTYHCRWCKKLYYKNFHEFFNFIERYDELCVDLDTPLVLIEPNERYYKEEYSSLRKIKVNINLKSRGITNLLHAATVYQLIDMFVSNVLVNDEMPATTPMTEQEKMQQHGFTHKYSFRKEPKR